jgi:circadian clock protein KaiC
MAGVERMPSGIEGLDELLGGGFERNSTVLVMGGTGTGKTTMLLQFLYNGAVNRKEPGLFLSFEEPKDAINKHFEAYGWDFEKLEEENMFLTVSYKPHEVKKLVDEGGGLIFDSIKSIDAKRIAIDSLTSYSMLFESAYQAREAQISLFEMVRKWSITAMFSGEEIRAAPLRTSAGMEYIPDVIIALHHPRQGGVRIHALEVLKIRGSTHSQKLSPFEFVSGVGMKVYPGQGIFTELGKDEEEKEG